MKSIQKNQLSRKGQQQFDQIVLAADLENVLEIPESVQVRDLAKTGTHSDRFNDGKFEVKFEGKAWVFDLGISAETIEVTWKFSVDPEQGSVIAKPSLISKINGPLDRAALKKALGCEPRVIGSLGRLEPLLPVDADMFGDIPVIYATTDEVSRLRAQLKSIL